MANEPQKKNILDQAIDLVTNRDEKAAAEEAQKRAADAEKAAAEAKAQVAKITAEADAVKKAAKEAEYRAGTAEAQKIHLEQEKYLKEMAEKKAKGEEAAKIAAAPKIIAEHTVAAGQTLSEIALQKYGSATQPYWMLIYETNKETIGANPNVIKAGQVLKIPELPASFKKK